MDKKEITTKQTFWHQIEFFRPEEFDDPFCPNSGFRYVNKKLVQSLDQLRRLTGWPIITHWEAGGCVDVNGEHNHARNSYHLIRNGACACDFHFRTDADPRLQARNVISSNLFTGIGIYYCWKIYARPLPIGFHVDIRPVEKYQLWVCHRKGDYLYLLN